MRPLTAGIGALALGLLACACVPGVTSQTETPNRAGTLVVAEVIESEAWPMIVGNNVDGLGSEVTELRRWSEDRQRPLTLDPLKALVGDATDATIPVSPRLALALHRLIQWYGLAATEDDPILHEQLEKATLGPAAILRIRDIFEAAIGRGIRTPTKWLTPEIGGEACINTELRLYEAADPNWPLVASLAKVARQPQVVADIYQRRRADLLLVDTHALLRLALERWKLHAPGAEAEVARAVDTLVENNASTYTHAPEDQLSLILRTDWSGRYVGRWHTHPPHDAGREWSGGGVPSFEDMQNAVAAGQYLTLVFQPDGFDLYDASALADAQRVDLTLMKVIHHRSPAWREHFQRLKQNLERAR